MAIVKRRVIIKLLDKIITRSETGFQTRNEEKGRAICAFVSGVGRAEFYRAAAVGMKPSVTFTVFGGDYARERLVKYDNKIYRVVRSYPIENRMIELVCEGMEPNDD